MRTRSRPPANSLVDARVVPGPQTAKQTVPTGLSAAPPLRAGDAGDRHRHRRAADPLRPLRHLARGRLADRAEVGDGLGLDAQDAGLHLVGVGDDAAAEESAGARLRRDELARQPAGARLGDRQRRLLRVQRLGDRRREGLAVDAVDAGTDPLAQLGVDLLEDRRARLGLVVAAHDQLDVVDRVRGAEVQRRALDPGQDPGQPVVDVRFAHPVEVPGARDRPRPAQLGQPAREPRHHLIGEHLLHLARHAGQEERLRRAQRARRTRARSRPCWAAPGRRSGCGPGAGCWASSRSRGSRTASSSPPATARRATCRSPSSSATTSTVRSSSVGPRPPVAMMTSISARSRTSAARIACGSSETTTCSASS